MTRLWPLMAGLILVGCTRFQPQPLAPAETSDQLEHRSLDDPGLKAFLEQNLKQELTVWPARSWPFEWLQLAAFYYHPSLEVARAQWAAAQGAEITAGQRPNPTLNVTPGYNSSFLSPTPWIPLGFIDMPIETAGKRRRRRAHAEHMTEVARLNIATAAWQVRSNLRTHLLEYAVADKRATLVQSQLAFQAEMLKRLEQQIHAGAIAPSDAFTLHVTLARTRLDLADIQRLRAESRARVAEAIGIPNHALDQVELKFEFSTEPETVNELTSAEMRRAALVSRSDVLGALAEYSAAESTLALEIAKQYPDVRLQPGYQFDQGQNKWSLGVTVDLPVLNQNQGPIAEAQAHRREAAARFQALQAKVMAEIDRAVAVFRTSATNLDMFNSLAEAQAKQRDTIAAQLKAGANDQLSFLTAQLDYVTTELAQLEGHAKLQQAFAGLEDAIQRPLPLPETLFQLK